MAGTPCGRGFTGRCDAGSGHASPPSDTALRSVSWPSITSSRAATRSRAVALRGLPSTSASAAWQCVTQGSDIDGLLFAGGCNAGRELFWTCRRPQQDMPAHNFDWISCDGTSTCCGGGMADCVPTTPEARASRLPGYDSSVAWRIWHQCNAAPPTNQDVLAARLNWSMHACSLSRSASNCSALCLRVTFSSRRL